MRMKQETIALGGLFVLVSLLLTGCAWMPFHGGGIDKQKAAAANADIGAEYLRKEENKRARGAFDKALGYDSDNFTANWGMAVASERLGAADEARRYFKKTLAIRSEPAIYNSYAAFLCEQGETEQGVAYFKRALKNHNRVDRAASLANAGLCLYRARHTQDAVDYFHRALALNPRQPTALAALAKAAYHNGNYLSARAFIERADEAAKLDADQLLLAARIELAHHDRKAAKAYLQRYNAKQTTVPRSLQQLAGPAPS
jgi:type IV pilus assembly protein PilF